MKEKRLTCIVCPNSCEILVEKLKEDYVVTGNKCTRGKDFAIKEMTNPQRTLCTTVKTTDHKVPRLSVRTEGEISKESIKAVMMALSKVTISKSISIGDVVVENILGTGINIIATSNFTLGGEEHGQ